MHSITPSRSKPATATRKGYGHLSIWAGVCAVAATVALGFAAPRFAGQAQARPEAAASQSAAVQERSVPSASKVFAEPTGAAVNDGQVPTF